MASETGNQGIYEPVPLMAPLRSFEEQEDEIIQGVSDVIRSGMWVYSNHGKALEEELNEFVGSEKSAVVASGTDALILALEGYGVKPGDEVITPAYSFFASASTIMLAGATPVFCDVSERTFNIDPDRIEEKITEKTVGIVAVHLYGLPADLDRINKIAEKHGLFVIEDACQAIGASVNGKKVGSGKNIAAYSFYPTKNLSAFGEGGALTGPDDEAMKSVESLRRHGETSRYHHSLLGRNSRLDEVQAFILRTRLKKLDEWTDRRIEIAGQYTEAWADLPLTVPYVPENYRHVFHLYVIKSLDREKLASYMQEKNIGHGVYYPVPLPHLEVFSGLGHAPGDFPIAEKLTREVLALPMFPQMTEGEVGRVIESVKAFYGI
jgi:hypothetical protein